MIKTILNKKFRYWTVPLALLALCIVGFGLLLPRLGFYWDDWAKILVSRIFGLEGYWEYYAEDRPISGWTHIFLTPILGNAPLNWQIFAFLMRWLSAWGMWWCFYNLWPQFKRQVTFTTLLFAVHPVFTLQPISVTFHQQWMQYALYFVSLGAMIQAYRKPDRIWLYMLLSILTQILQLSITEYFIGLELLRPVVLWFLVSQDQDTFRQRIRGVIKYGWPYMLILLGYVIWRLFFIQLPGEDPYRAEMLYALIEQPRSAAIKLVKNILMDTFYILVTSWAPPLYFGIDKLDISITPVIWGIAIISAAILAYYLVHLNGSDANREKEISNRIWIRQALVIGLLATVLGFLPAWITDRRVIFDFHSNRYAMPSMFAASLVVVAALEWISNQHLQKSVVISSLIGLALVFHIDISYDHSKLWSDQTSFFWQLHWRAPYLEPQTAILSEYEFFPNQGGFSTSAALNLLYPQPKDSEHLAYWFYGMRPRFVASASKPLGIYLKTQFRTLTYIGETPNSLIIYFDPNRANCMWVLGPDDQYNPDLSDFTKQMLPASNLERIKAEPITPGYPPTELFGSEPEHSWCYLYQKADWARQMQDWSQIVELADEARSQQGHHPADNRFKTPHEWLPFIEGYAYVSRWDDAQQLIIAAADMDIEKYAPGFCRLWKRFIADTPSSLEKDGASAEVFAHLECAELSAGN